MEKTSAPSSSSPESTPATSTQSSGNNNWLYILGGCCCLLLLGLIIAGAIAIFYFSTNQAKISKEWDSFDSSISNDIYNNTSYDDLFSDLETDNVDSNNLDTKTTTTGIIEGSLSYPGEKIPSDLEVCAENIFYSDQVYCADGLINDSKYTNSTGYTIEAPVGSYYVYSYEPTKPDQKAFYTDFVDCGLKAECTSHDKLIIDVYPDETTDQVDPIDWYNQ
ncbi:MAG: hypothetical protein ACOZAR_02695 [Patescibacteria group bacterium]